jgi:protein-disulfide isomerase
MNRGGDRLRLATLGALVVLLIISFLNWREIGRIRESLDNRLGQLENQIGQVASKMDTLPAGAAQPARRGPDPNRVYQIKTAGSPYKGPASAPITIAEFSDFQCPFCARATTTLKEIEDVYGDRVRIVWKHNPLPFHKDSPLAHAASLAAEKQGKFWEYHDKLFTHQKALKRENLEAYARELGLDMEKFRKDLTDTGDLKKIEADKAEARSLQATGTPAFFINGHYLRGARPFEDFAKVINAELARLKLPVPAKAQGG